MLGTRWKAQRKVDPVHDKLQASVPSFNAGRRRLLIAGASVFVLAVGYRVWSRTPPDFGGNALSATEAHALALSGDITLIDIRTPREWRRTGLGQGAHPIDMRREDFLDRLIQVAGPDHSAPIALICARGVRSARLGNALKQAGYTNISDVSEGMLGSHAGPGWLKHGLPLRPHSEGDE